jgi:hypothetical protein
VLLGCALAKPKTKTKQARDEGNLWGNNIEGVAARAAIAHRTRTAYNLKDGRWMDLN